MGFLIQLQHLKCYNFLFTNKIKIMRILVIFITFFTLIGCSIKTIYLKDQSTKVAKNKKVYKNKKKISNDIFSIIDTNAIYEECIFQNGQYTPLRLVQDEIFINNEYYSVYKFYPNGNVNHFYFNSKKILFPELFDPEYTGERGVCYWRKRFLSKKKLLQLI